MYQYHLEREHNSRLMEYIARAEQIELGLRAENERLRKRVEEVEQREPHNSFCMHSKSDYI